MIELINLGLLLIILIALIVSDFKIREAIKAIRELEKRL